MWKETIRYQADSEDITVDSSQYRVLGQIVGLLMMEYYVEEEV